ncbi:peptidase inhibitor family I36 protein [Amycolatopsis nigrescens]|uniref:peptidase inhibitor family I36 protein n=1 Tax=Amycolatopsis nigrescens TaxID=381445 RepID=UPI000372BA22|nr:peptidase inhibitor family I36 protein [Amycolatopsis nigrescens]
MRAFKIFLAATALAFTMGATPATASVDESSLTEATMASSASTTCHGSGPTAYCITTAPEGIPCPSGWICLYTESAWREMQVRWPAGNYHPDFGLIPCPAGVPCNNGGPGFDDEMSSWRNNTDIFYCVDSDPRPGSPTINMPPRTGSAYIDDSWNDWGSALSSSGC